MLFFQYFRMKLGSRIKITLKNGMVMTGRLTNIDPFLNMRIEDIVLDTNHPALNEMSVCSIRGSAIKTVAMDLDQNIDRAIVNATRVKWCLDSKE